MKPHNFIAVFVQDTYNIECGPSYDLSGMPTQKQEQDQDGRSLADKVA